MYRCSASQGDGQGKVTCSLYHIIIRYFDPLQTELNRLEQSMADSRKQREKVLSDYRTKANEKKEFAEKVERRVSPKLEA